MQLPCNHGLGSVTKIILQLGGSRSYSQSHKMSTIRTLWTKSIVKLTVPEQKTIKRINKEKLAESTHSRRIPKHSNMCDHVHQRWKFQKEVKKEMYWEIILFHNNKWDKSKKEMSCYIQSEKLFALLFVYITTNFPILLEYALPWPLNKPY